MKTVTKEQADKMLASKSIETALFDKGYTILMPRNRARKWLKALRSGEYIQAEGALHDPETGGFCCLGVEQYVNNGEVVENSFKNETCNYGSWNAFPTDSYLKNAGMLYVNSFNSKSTNPYILSENEDVSELNDSNYTRIRKVNQYKEVVETLPVNDFSAMADFLDKAMLVY